MKSEKEARGFPVALLKRNFISFMRDRLLEDLLFTLYLSLFTHPRNFPTWHVRISQHDVLSHLGSEERQLSQFCRACGTDLRVVRQSLERPDTITASAVSAREQISRALADRIRQLETGKDLEHVAEDVLPHLEKFLESPEEKRLRRVRAGVITVLVGVGVSLAIFLASLRSSDLVPFIALGLIVFFVGLGIILNGLVLSVPGKRLADRSAEAESQRELEARIQTVSSTNQLSPFVPVTNDLPPTRVQRIARPSVTEHTTHQLRQEKLKTRMWANAPKYQA